MDALSRARSLFLDDARAHGCAEATMVALKHAFRLPQPDDAAPAMALNGGIAHSGATCGALTGAALAVGMLAGRRIDDHEAAKQAARATVAEVIDAFQEEFGATNCRALTGLDLRAPGVHQAFIAEGTWRTACMRQIAFVIDRLAPLAEHAGEEPDVGSGALRH